MIPLTFGVKQLVMVGGRPRTPAPYSRRYAKQTCAPHRSLATRTDDHEQEGRSSGSQPIPLRAPHPPRQPSYPLASPVPHAPLPFRIPIEHVLRGNTPERRHCARTPPQECRLSVAAADHADVLPPEPRTGRDLVEWYFVPEQVGHCRRSATFPRVVDSFRKTPQDGSFERRKDRHAVLQGWRHAESDRYHHAVRGSALVHRLVHAGERFLEEGTVQGDRGRLGRRFPGAREGLHHHELRAKQRAPGHRVLERPAASQRRLDSCQVWSRHPRQPQSSQQGELFGALHHLYSPEERDLSLYVLCDSTRCGTTSSRTTRRRRRSSRVRSTTCSRP